MFSGPNGRRYPSVLAIPAKITQRHNCFPRCLSEVQGTSLALGEYSPSTCGVCRAEQGAGRGGSEGAHPEGLKLMTLHSRVPESPAPSRAASA